MTKPLVLLPTPRQLEFHAGNYKLEPGKRIVLVGARAPELLFSGQRLRDALHDLAHIDWTLAASASGARHEIGAMLCVDPARVSNAEGYTIDIKPDSVEVVARSPCGIFYAVCT